MLTNQCTLGLVGISAELPVGTGTMVQKLWGIDILYCCNVWAIRFQLAIKQWLFFDVFCNIYISLWFGFCDVWAIRFDSCSLFTTSLNCSIWNLFSNDFLGPSHFSVAVRLASWFQCGGFWGCFLWVAQSSRNCFLGHPIYLISMLEFSGNSFPMFSSVRVFCLPSIWVLRFGSRLLSNVAVLFPCCLSVAVLRPLFSNVFVLSHLNVAVWRQLVSQCCGFISMLSECCGFTAAVFQCGGFF